jgi:hypothetical protein
MMPGDIFLVLALAIVIAIPLAWLMHIAARAWQIHKLFKPLRKTVPNIEIADEFKLHEVGAKQRKPRARKSNVTSLRDPPEAA